MTCNCPRIDGYFVVRKSCNHHPRRARQPFVETETVVDPEQIDAACAWADYRKDFGVPASQMTAAHKAFLAGWKSARQGDQSQALR